MTHSKVTIRAEDDNGAGSFKPPVDVGGFQASPEWGLNWSGVAPQFSLKARISATAQLCTDSSPRSPDEITETPPSPVPPGFVEKPVIDGQTIVKVWGQDGPPSDPPTHGVILTVRDGVPNVRGQTTAPGGAPHLLGIGPPAVASQSLTATQALCTERTPGTPTTVGACSAMPAPVLKPPLPGDTQIVVTQAIPVGLGNQP